MNIVIIGGIAAGMSAAAKALRVNPSAKITIIEMENYISFGACGLPYYLGGRFEDSSMMFARTPQQMEKAGLRLLLGHQATKIDFEQKIVSVRNLDNESQSQEKYDKLMIATGASAKLPDYDGMNADNVYTITRLQSTQKLKDNLDLYQRIGIIGAGYIGIEVASELAHLGKEVHLFDRNSFPVHRSFDKELGDFVSQSLQEDGIQLHLNAKIKNVQTSSHVVTGLICDDQTYPLDALVVGAGFRPNTQLFDSPALKKLENGAILIDRYGRTTIPDVFSGGDCASVPHLQRGDVYLPLATSANKIGRMIGENFFAEDDSQLVAYEGSLGSSQLKAGEYEFATTGLTQQMAEEMGLNVKTTCINAENHAGYWPGQSLLKIKLVYDAQTKKILGAQLGGKDGAALRLSAYTTAIYAGLTTQQMGGMDIAYAPPFATTWDAINVAANTAK